MNGVAVAWGSAAQMSSGHPCVRRGFLAGNRTAHCDVGRASPRWAGSRWRAALRSSAMAAIGSAALAATLGASAGAIHQPFTDFGDSYADTGRRRAGRSGCAALPVPLRIPSAHLPAARPSSTRCRPSITCRRPPITRSAARAPTTATRSPARARRRSNTCPASTYELAQSAGLRYTSQRPDPAVDRRQRFVGHRQLWRAYRQIEIGAIASAQARSRRRATDGRRRAPATSSSSARAVRTIFL